MTIEVLEHVVLTASCSTTLGIPQGSVHGPLLFAVFVENVCTVFQHSDHISYANDTQILDTNILSEYCNLSQTSTMTLIYYLSRQVVLSGILSYTVISMAHQKRHGNSCPVCPLAVEDVEQNFL
ncbi:hypothetical protein TKK_0016116 [Trichogramma kaykai]